VASARSDVLRAFSPVENLRRIFFRGGSVGEKHLAPLDGLRGLALLWVLLVHVGWYGWFSFAPGVYPALLGARWMLPIWRGDFAVEVFFVMSGFLIGGLITDERDQRGKVNVGLFYARRLLRLWPALVVGVLVERALLGGHAAHELWPNILYVNNLFPILSIRMGWTWSLAIEEQFYIVVPWLLLGLATLGVRGRAMQKLPVGRDDAMLKGLGALMAVMVAVVAAVVVVHDMHVEDSEVALNRAMPLWARGYDVLYSKPWMRAGPLLVGLLTSRLYRIGGFMARLGQTGWKGTLGLVLAFVVGFLSMHWPLFQGAPRPLEVLYLASYRTVFGLAVGYGMLLVLSPHPVGAALGRLLSAPILFPLAQLAYCTYLMNPIVSTLTHAAVGPSLPSAGAAFAVLAILDVPLSLAAGLTLSVLVERPFMELRRVLTPHR
jgi:peptidoglycan/LPS O-acetylase OafA/YrhL